MTKSFRSSDAVRRCDPVSIFAANLDLVVLLGVILFDVRVFEGSDVASFTLFELFIWGYCAPYVISCMGIKRRTLSPPCWRFLSPITLYISWLLFASCMALIFRADSGVLQDTKNVVPALVLVLFIFLRVRDMQSIILLCNLYMVYALLACILGLLQVQFGGPYFRDLLSGTEYKVDIEGAVIANPLVGFSRHPNEFAMAIVPGVAMAILKLICDIRDGWRIEPATVVVAAILCLAMGLSSARGAIVFTAAAVVFIASPLGRTRAFFFKLWWVFGLTALIVIYGLHQAQYQGPQDSETVETRFLLWKTAYDAITSDGYVLLFGDGMKFVSKWSVQIAGWEFPDAHNAWIDQVLFFGLPAIFMYVAIWSQFFRIVEALPLTASPRYRVLMEGLRATVIALMGDYFFEPVAHAVFPISQLFLVMALAVRIASLASVEENLENHVVKTAHNYTMPRA